MTEQSSRDRLVEAMSRSLQRRGFGATGMKEVLATAGVSSGSMYHAFPGGKEELAAASIRSSGLRSAAAIRAALGKAPTAAAGVQVIFAALARDLERSRFLYGCPIGTPATEAAAVSDQIQAACREVFDAWVAAYRDALVAEGWAEAAADTQALAIVTAYEGSVTIARALRNTAPVVTTGEDLIARIEAGDTKTSEEDR